MGIEKDGLDYEIKIIDTFSANNQKFKDQLNESKAAFDSFKTSLASAGAASAELRDNQREIAAALKSSATSLKDYNTEISNSNLLNKSFVKASGNRATALQNEKALLGSVNRLNQFRLKQQEKVVELDVQNAGVRQQLADATRQLNDQIKQIIRINRTESATIRQKVGLLTRELKLKRQLATVALPRQSGGGGGGGGSGQQRQASALNKTLQDTDSTSNRLLFTFRRLFGVLAAFTLARVAVGGFRDLIKAGIAFNSKIEDTTLGIASLITALSDVSDATGQSVDAVGKLALAEREATKQVGLLKKEALTTAATFDQLLETFQVALAPGFTAGLGIDQIRKLTVQISQAATAIALPQNQLAEEIRSLLSGTIQARTTRIATALGISNEDIRKAKELGTLFEFLTDRFKAFTVAGEKAQKNLSVALTNVKDGLIQIIAEGFQGGEGGTLGLFEELKSLIFEINDAIKSTGKDDFIQLNPNLVALVRRVADGLKESVIQAKLLIQNLSFEQALSIATTLGQVLKTGAQAAGVLVEGIVRGLTAIGDVVNLIGDAFRLLDQALPKGVLRTMLVAALALSTAFIGLKIILISIPAAIFKWVGVTKLVTAAFVIMRAEVVGATGVIAAMTAAFRGLGAAAAATSLGKFLFPIALLAGGTAILAQAFTSLANAILGTNLKFTTFIKLGLDQAIGKFEQLNNRISIFRKGIDASLSQNKETRRRLVEEIRLLQKRNKEIDDALLLGQIQTLLADPEEGKDVADIVSDIVDKVLGGGKKIQDSFDASSASAKSFGQIISELPPIITEATDRLEGQVDNVKELREEILKAKDDLRFVQESLGLENTVLDQARTIFEGQVEAREATKKLTEKQISFEQRLLRATLDREAAERRFNLLLDDEKLKVNDLISLANDLALSNEVSQKLETQLILTKQEIQRAGTIEEKKALQEKLDFIKSALATEKLATAENLKQADALAEGVDAGKLVELKDIFNALITNRTLEAVLEEKIQRIQEQRLKTESEINEKVSARITEQALKGTVDTKKEIDDLVSKLRLQEATNAAIRDGVQERLETGAAGVVKAEIDGLQKQLDVILKQNAAQREKITLRLEELALDEQGTPGEEELALRAQKDALNNKQLLTEQNINAEIDERNAKLALTNELTAATPFEVVTIGIREAFDGLKKETENVFGFIKDLTVNTVNSAADLVSGVIVDALDPSKDVNIKERLGKFLQDIAQQIIAFLIKIAIVKSALQLGLVLGGAEGGLVPAVSKAQGGKIPRRGRASAAHFGAPVGHSRGRMVRPRGLDRRDTVPIWAQEGEFMMRLAAVRMYGERVMGAINEGLVDPFSLRALASSSANSPIIRKPKTGGFAKGGGVSAAPQLSRSRQEVGPALAVSVASEREFNRMIAQGRPSLIRFVEENRTTIKNILDRK